MSKNKKRTAQLVAYISRETDIDENIVRYVLDTLGMAVGSGLKQGNSVHIAGFGEFNVYQRIQKAQQVKALQGSANKVAGRPAHVVTFRQSRGLKELLRCQQNKTKKKKK